MPHLSTQSKKRVKKVVSGLKKAVKAHTKQHKSLSKVLGRHTKKKKK